MKCGQALLLISPYLDEELDTVRHQEVESHLATCPACMAKLSALRMLSHGLALYGQALRQSDIEAGLAAIKARLSQEIGRPSFRERVRFAWEQLVLFHRQALYAAGAAACLAIIVFSWLFLGRGPQSNGLPMTPTTGNGKPAMVESIEYGGNTVIIFENPKTNSTLIWLTPSSTEDVTEDDDSI